MTHLLDRHEAQQIRTGDAGQLHSAQRTRHRHRFIRVSVALAGIDQRLGNLFGLGF